MKLYALISLHANSPQDRLLCKVRSVTRSSGGLNLFLLSVGRFAKVFEDGSIVVASEVIKQNINLY
jgi:hypothetical protein